MEGRKIAKYAFALAGFGVLGLGVAAASDAKDDKTKAEKETKIEKKESKLDLLFKAPFYIGGYSLIYTYKALRCLVRFVASKTRR